MAPKLNMKELKKFKKKSKNCCQNTEFKMAAKFKMVTNTKFAYVAKKTLVRHIEYDYERQCQSF
jgi:hypothetical protein